MNRKWLSAWLFAFLLMLALAGCASAGSAEGWLYAENPNGTVTVLGVEDASAQALTLPLTLDGKPVTGLGPRAFAGMESLEGVLFHAGVDTFDPCAFEGFTGAVHAYCGAPVLEAAAKAGVTVHNRSVFDLADDVLDLHGWGEERIRLEDRRVWVSGEAAHLFEKGTRFLAWFEEDDTQTVRKVAGVEEAEGGVYLKCTIVPAYEVLEHFSFDLRRDAGEMVLRGDNQTNYRDFKTHTVDYKTKNGLLSIQFDIDFNINPDVSGDFSYKQINDFRSVVYYTADVTVTGTLGGTLLSVEALKFNLESITAGESIVLDLMEIPKKITIPNKFSFSYSAKLKIDLKVVGSGKVHFEGYDGFVYENGMMQRVNDFSREIDEFTVKGEFKAGLSVSAALSIPLHGRFLSLSSELGMKTKTESMPCPSPDMYCFNLPIKAYMSASMSINVPIFRSLSYNLMSLEFPLNTYHLEVPVSPLTPWLIHVGEKCTIDPETIEIVKLLAANGDMHKELWVRHGSSILSSLDYEPMPELEGNEFVGWFDKPSGGTQYDLAVTVTEGYPDVLYAQYRKPPVRVVVDHGWDLIPPREYELYPGSLVKAPKLTGRVDYKLMGWFANGRVWDFETDTVPDGGVTITAVWQEAPGYNPFTVELDVIRNGTDQQQQEHFANFTYTDMMSTGLQGMGLTKEDDPDLARLHSVVSITGFAGTGAMVPPDNVNAIQVKLIDGTSMTKDGITSLAMPANCLLIKGMNNAPALTYVDMNVGLAIVEDNCFANDTLLQGFNTPISLRKIGSSAFMNCTSLMTAYVNSRIDVGEKAFANCVSLVEVSGLMNRVYTNTFANCFSLVSLPRMQDAYIYERAFAGCTSLEKLHFYGNTTFVEAIRPFEGCTALKELVFEGDVNDLPLNYSELQSLETIIVYGNVTGDVQLSDLPKLETLRIDGNVEGRIYLENLPNLGGLYVGGDVNGNLIANDLPRMLDVIIDGKVHPGSTRLSISDCPSITELDLSFVSCSQDTKIVLAGNTGMMNVTLPESLEVITQYMFNGCSALGEIVLPEGVRIVEDHAFDNCTSLTHLTLNSSLTNLGSSLFDNTPHITRLEIPSSVTVIGTPFTAPDMGGSLIGVICEESSAIDTYISDIDFIAARREDEKRYTLCFSSNAKSTSSAHVTYLLSAGDDIASLAPEWTLPSGTYFSGWYLDSECTRPYDLSLGMPQGDTCLYMGRTQASTVFEYEMRNQSYVITGYTGTQDMVVIPSVIDRYAVSGIDEGAFSDSLVRAISLPGTMTGVSGKSFSGMDKLETINTYGECTALKSVNGVLLSADGQTLVCAPRARRSLAIPQGVRFVAQDALRNAAFRAVTIPEGVEEIHEFAFAGMENLVRVDLPSTLNRVENGAFADCENLECMTLLSEPEFGVWMFSLMADMRASGPESDTLREFFANYHIPYNEYDLVWMNGEQEELRQLICQGELIPFFTDVPAPEGAVLEGWKAEGSDVLWDFTADEMPSSALTLCAVWAPVWQADEEGMLVSYNALAGEEAVVPEQVEDAEVTGIRAGTFEQGMKRISIPACVERIEPGALPEGAVIVADEGSAAQAYAAENGLTFEKRLYEITFDSMGGSRVEAITLAAGDELTLPEPVRDLCLFTGWLENGALFEETLMPARNLSLMAGWTEPDGYTPLFRTREEADGVWITGYSGAPTQVELPLAINGQKVLGVTAGAFRGSMVLEKVTVPDGFPVVEKEAFASSAVRSVVFLGADTQVGEGAFSRCQLLNELVLPSGLAEIPARMAQGAGSLTTLDWPEGLVSIGDRAFEDCVSLNAALPDTLQCIGDRAFENAESLTITEIPHGVLTLGQRAFAGCTGIRVLALPDHLTTLPAGLLNGCAGLESITLPASLTALSDNAFAGCESLSAIHVPEGNGHFSSEDGMLLTADGETLLACPAARKDETLVIPSGVKTLGEASLSGCRFSALELPEGLTTMEDRAVENCVNLTGVTLPESLKHIGSRVFDGCAQLNGIQINEGLETAAADAFPSGLSFTVDSDWPALRALIPAIKAGVSVTVNPVETSADELTTEPFGDGLCVTAYTGAGAGVVLPEKIGGRSVLAIGPGAFEGLYLLHIPQSVTTLMDGALTQSPDLTLLTGGEGVTSAGRAAVEGIAWAQEKKYVGLGDVLMLCRDTAYSISLNGAWPVVGADAFRGMTGLISISLSGVHTLGDRAFMDCVDLSSISDSQSVTAIGSQVISGTAMEDNQVTIGLFLLNVPNWGMEEFSFGSGTAKIILGGALDNAGITTLIIDGEDCVLRTGAAQASQTLRFVDATAVTSLTIEEGALPSGTVVAAAKDSAIWQRAQELGYEVRETMPSLITISSYNLPLSLSLGSSKWLGTNYEGGPLDQEDVIALSSDENVFTVTASVNQYDYDGVTETDVTIDLYPVAVGEAVLTLGTADGVTEYPVTVRDDRMVLSSPSTGTSFPLAVGETLQIAAKTSSGTVLEGLSVTMSEYSSGQATLTEDGRITGVSEGTVYLTLKCEGYQDLSVNANVIAAPTGMIIASDAVTAQAGTYAYVKVTLQGTTFGRIQCQSSNPQVAAASMPTNSWSWTTTADGASANLSIIGYSAGEAVMTLTDTAGHTGTIHVTITPRLVSSLTLYTTSLTMQPGETRRISVSVSPSSASNKTLKWVSSDEAVATVDENGQVTAKGFGEATITASTTDGSNLSKTCAVTVEGMMIVGPDEVEGGSRTQYTLVSSSGGVPVMNWSTVDNDSDSFMDWDEGVLYADSTYEGDYLLTILALNQEQSLFVEKQVLVKNNWQFEASVNLPASLSVIADEAFAFSPVKTVRCPDGMTAIGDGAFRGCEALEGVYLPESVTSISPTAFEDCPNVTLYTPSGSTAESYGYEHDLYVDLVCPPTE